MDELLQDFLAETAEIMEEIGGEIIAWESNPSDRDRLDAIFRFVHTVKGSSGFLDLKRIGALAHAAEDALGAVRDGTREATPAMVSAVLAIIDRITSLSAEIERDGVEPEGSDAPLIASLAQSAGEGVGEAAEAAAPVPAQAEPGGVLRSIRVPLSLLDNIMNGVSDIVLARNEVARQFREASLNGEVVSAFERLSGSIADMRNAVSQMRMQRIEKLFSALPRTVRDLSARLDKRVELIIEGSEVEIDREMIEMIRDPLTHIVRNAIDHGIETVAKRTAAGKNGAGLLTVAARQSGNQIVVEVSDDGGGVSLDRLVSKAIDAKLITQGDANAMSAAEKLELLFSPGLSTASKVTDISGRGVGMDVVRANVERIGGVVDVENRFGEGFTVRLRVPMTLTIISGLTVRAGSQRFALPRSNILEILMQDSDAARIDRAGGAEIVLVRGQRLALVCLDDVLGLPRAENDDGDRTLVLVRPASGKPYALSVQEVLDQEELVIRPAAPQIMGSGLYAGTTLPDSGRPMLLIDPSGVAIKASVFEDARGAEADLSHIEADDDEGDAVDRQMLLFSEYDGRKRAVRLPVIDRVEDIDAGQISLSAGQWRATLGDEIVPVFTNGVPEGLSRLKMLSITDGNTTVGYPIAEVIDIVDTPFEMAPAGHDGLASGVALIGGEQVEVIDPHWIFSEVASLSMAQPQAKPVCRIDHGDDEWARLFLAPMVEAAGYKVILGDMTQEDSAPSIVICSAHIDSAVPVEQGTPIIRLRAQAARLRKGDDSIYRYDRNALVNALKAGRQR